MLTYRAIVAIASLVFYIPALLTSLKVAYAQGPGNNAAYVWLTLLTCIRIVGFSIQLRAETHHQDANTTFYTGVAVLLNIGLSPLLLSSVGMLSRVNGAVGRRMACTLILTAVPIMLALALLVAGSIDPTSQEGPTFSANGEIKTGVALYLICFIALCYATAIILFRKHLALRDDRNLGLVVAISLPFMFVRVMYITLFAFAAHGNSEWFNVISGDETTQLCMQVVQEYIIVLLYLLVGLNLNEKHREREVTAAIAEAHPGRDFAEKRTRITRTCRYIPVVYWFITVREVTNPR
jgi:hypothetical protein